MALMKLDAAPQRRVHRLALIFAVAFTGCGGPPSTKSQEESQSTTSDSEENSSSGQKPDPESSTSSTESIPDTGSDEENEDSTKPDKDSGFPSTLDGLDLDLNALFNYRLQELPQYISQDNSSDNNPITDEGATLGRVLFYDPRLSTTNKISCASCHQQTYAFGDPRPLSDGVAGKTLRHSMRLVNIRFSEDFQARWDRKANSIEDQMLMPIQDHVEMGYSGKEGNPNLDDLVQKLQDIKAYQVLFRLAWGDKTVSKDRIARSLAQFVRSIQSFDSKYDEGRAQVQQEHEPFPNFSEDENAGKALFLGDFNSKVREVELEVKGIKKSYKVAQRVSGGLNCSVCHRPPEFDIDPRSRNNGVTQAANPNTKESADYEAVRSASLRDLVNPGGKLNGGLFHIGQSMELSGVAEHYNFVAPDEDNYLLDRRFSRREHPVHLKITATESRQLAAFLRTLSGRAIYTDKRWSNPFTSR